MITDTPFEQKWFCRGAFAGVWALDLQEKWLSTKSTREGRKCAVDLEDVCLRRREWRTRAPSDGHGRSGSPRQPGLHEARFGIVEGTAPANLEGDPTMRIETRSRNPEVSPENVPNPVNLDTKDEALVAEAVRGSSAAFEVLFQRYQQKCFHVALSRLQNTQDAEDAVQQTFQQALFISRVFRVNRDFPPGLPAIAINEALMLIRKRRPGHFSIEGHQTVDEESFTARNQGPGRNTRRRIWPAGDSQRLSARSTNSAQS